MKNRKLLIVGTMVALILVAGAAIALAQGNDDTPSTPPFGETTNTEGVGPGPGGFNGHRGPGRRGFGRGPKGGPERAALETVARELGMSVEEMRAELATGKSIADLAAEQGIDVQTIVDAVIEAGSAHLDAAVEAGDLTQEQADAIREQMPDRIETLISRTFDNGGPGQHGEHGRFGKGRPGFGPQLEGSLLSVTAEQLDMSVEEVRNALQEGASIADLVAEQGVDVQAIIDATLEARQTALANAVDSGQMTQEQADTILANMAEGLQNRVNQSGLPGFPGGRPGRGCRGQGQHEFGPRGGSQPFGQPPTTPPGPDA
ncbi:MAG: hypothetical protein ACE5E7_10045 [Anaerolineae bacterium]